VTQGSPTLLGDVIVTVSGVLLAERTVFLARAVQRLDPVKLLLAQAVVGTVLFVVVSSLVEPAKPAGRQGWACRSPIRRTDLGIQLRGEPVAPAPIPSERALGVLSHPTDLRRRRGDAGDRRPAVADLLMACAAVAVGIGLASR